MSGQINFLLPTDDLEYISSKLKTFWPKNKIFLLTGSTGFFGHWFCEAIAYIEEELSSNNHYYIISRNSSDFLSSKIPVLSDSSKFTCLQADLNKKLVLDKKYDFVLHAAADVSHAKGDTNYNFENAVNVTRNLLNAVEANFGKLLYVSSGAVYGSGPFDETCELTIPREIKTYADAKKKNEDLILKQSNTVVARCFSFVGGFADPNMAIMNMLQSKIEGKPINLRSPDVVRSYLYASDMVISLMRLLFSQNSYRIYNIGSNKPVKLRELADQISSIKNKSKIQIEESVLTTTNALAGSVYLPNTDRYDLEYSPQMTISLNVAIEKTFNFLTKGFA